MHGLHLVTVITTTVLNANAVTILSWLVINYSFPSSRSETFRVVSYGHNLVDRVELLKRVTLFQFTTATSLHHEYVEEYRHLMANVAPERWFINQ